MHINILYKKYPQTSLIICLLAIALILPVFSNATQVKSKSYSSFLKNDLFTMRMNDESIIIEYISANLTYEIVTDDHGESILKTPVAV